MQAFTLTFYARKAISGCYTISSIDFLSELYCKDTMKAKNWLEVVVETRKAVIKVKVIKVIKKMGIGHFEL